MNNNDRLLVVAGVVLREGRVMLCQRRPEVHNGLKWEFPGGKLEPGESPEEALKRELREELSIDVRVSRVVDNVYFRYPDRDVLLMFYRCEIIGGEPAPVDCNAVAWVSPEDVPGYDFAGADRMFVERFRKQGTEIVAAALCCNVLNITRQPLFLIPNPYSLIPQLP